MMIDLRGIIKFIVMVLGMTVLVLWLASCSKEYHIKRSAHHYDKALEKGYEPEYDSVTTKLEGIKSIPFNLTLNSKIEIASKIDSALQSNQSEPLTEPQKQGVLKVIETIPKYINIDTTAILEDGSKVQVKAKQGYISISLDKVCLEQKPIYIEETLLEHLGINKWWEKALFWLVIGIGLVLLILRFIVPLIKPV